MSHLIVESDIEDTALEILEELDYEIVHGPYIAPDDPEPERQN